MGVLNADELQHLERELARFLLENAASDPAGQLPRRAGGGAGIWQKFAELGWLGIGIPGECGGLGGGLADLLPIFGAAGKGLLQQPLTSTLVLGAGLIELLGSGEQRRAWLPSIASGRMTIGCAHTVGGIAGKNAGIVAAWDAEAAAYTLSGTTRAVLHGPTASHLMVAAQEQHGGALQVHLIAANAPGVKWNTYRMIDGQIAGDLECSRVTAQNACRLEAGSVTDALQRTLAAAAIAVAAESVGTMDRLNELSRGHLLVRKQFGRPLGSFQVLQHRMVDMWIAARQAAATVKWAATAFDAGSADTGRLAAASKIVAARAGRLVGEQGIQIHGAMGMTEECMAGRCLKRLMLLGGLFGGVDHHLGEMALEIRARG